jgi:hypothetical protein
LNLDNLFPIAGVIAEIAIVGLLLYRRVWRRLPVFVIYCVWALFSDATALVLRLGSPKGYSSNFYIAITLIDLVLQLSVIVELAWSVLRPLRGGLSRHAIWVVAALILVAGAAIWPFAGVPAIYLPTKVWHFVEHLQQTVSILRVLFFVSMAACSHLLGLGLRDRELQVATGFGFYSLISLCVAALMPHATTRHQYSQLYSIVAIGFLCSLLYWVFSFAQKEAERREFTPQAKEILMAVARTARVSRVELEDFATARRESF